MQLEQLKTPSGEVMQGPLLITPQAFGDDRGWFYESWNQRKFDEAVGESVLFSQDNHSRSIQGVLRGLHYQLKPEPRGKHNALHGLLGGEWQKGGFFINRAVGRLGVSRRTEEEDWEERKAGRFHGVPRCCTGRARVQVKRAWATIALLNM